MKRIAPNRGSARTRVRRQSIKPLLDNRSVGPDGMREKPLRDRLATQALRSGQTIRFRIPTASMIPTLWPGDLILVAKAEPEVGDIALAWTGDFWLAHFVVKKRRERFWLAGVGDDHRGAPVPRNSIHGRVVDVKHDTMSRLLLGQYVARRIYGMARRFGARIFSGPPF